MARSAVKVTSWNDWTGGLNVRDDAYQLADNELADVMNMDIKPQGGLHRRRTVNQTSSGIALAQTKNVWQFLGATSPELVVVTNGTGHDDLWWSDDRGTTWTDVAFSGETTGQYRAVAMNRLTSANSERLYLQRNTEQVPVKFDGSALTALTDAHGAYNEDVALPAGGKMPKARYITAHMGFCFVAATLEGSTHFENRIRFSHPGEPEDWRADDYIDIDSGVDADEITGIAAYKDQLFIFKNRSVHVLTGYDEDTFAVVRVADVGAVSQEAIASSGLYGVAFFDARLGVHVITDNSVNATWHKLNPLITDGTIQAAYLSKIVAGWLGERLYVSVPYDDGATYNTRTFVFDPTVGEGAWWQYGYGMGPMVEYRPTNEPTFKYALFPDGIFLMEIDAGTDVDVLIDGATPYDSWFTTAWQAIGMPGVKKRWRRPMLVIDSNVDTLMGVTVYRNYSLLSGARTFSIGTIAPVTGLLWSGDGSGGLWGTGMWGASPRGEQDIVRGSGLGRAYAVAMRVAGPPDGDWGLNAIEFHYIVQRIR